MYQTNFNIKQSAVCHRRAESGHPSRTRFVEDDILTLEKQAAILIMPRAQVLYKCVIKTMTNDVLFSSYFHIRAKVVNETM